MDHLIDAINVIGERVFWEDAHRRDAIANGTPVDMYDAMFSEPEPPHWKTAPPIPSLTDLGPEDVMGWIPPPSPKTLLEMLHHIEGIIKRVHDDLEREGNGQ